MSPKDDKVVAELCECYGREDVYVWEEPEDVQTAIATAHHLHALGRVKRSDLT